MKNKSMLVLGIVLVIVLIAIVGLVTIYVTNQNNLNGNNISDDMSSKVPVLELETNTNEENQEAVTITAFARTEDEGGIKSITLPDGSVNLSDNVIYKVTENGSYTFETEANNGQTASLTIDIDNIKVASSNEPYIPEGFSHTEGKIDNGYTIQDTYGNEYVWVPIPSGKLTRNTSQNSDYEETNSTVSELVNSVAQNYGFYMAKYESSSYQLDDKQVAASMKGATPLTNITYPKASEMASRAADAFGYENCNTAIVNSYAWDSTLNWIDETFEDYSSSTSYGNYSGSVNQTGGTESDIKNNICDLAGNVREWTTEVYKTKGKNSSDNNTNTNSANQENNTTNEETVEEQITYRVVRGGSANLNKTANSHTGYEEVKSDAYWGFRMILYK